jgi:hypothetical protein
MNVLTLLATAATAFAGSPLDSWQTVQPKTTPQSGISYGGGRWVGWANGLISSTNGSDWEGVSLTHDFYFNGFKYASGLWVAAGDRFVYANCGDGYNFRDGLFTSTNGLDWADHPEATQILYDLGADALVRDVAYGNGRWIVLGRNYGRYLTSTDAINWTPNGLGPFLISSDTTRSISYGNGLWIITGDYGSASGFLFTSSNGLNWGAPITAPAIFNCASYGNGQWVACSQDRIWTSSNGLNWTSRYQGIVGQDSLPSVTYANGQWVCVGYRYGNPYYVGLVLTSTDSVNWTLVRQDTARVYYGAAYGDNQWAINGGDNAADQNNYIGALLTSKNGTTWTDHTVQSTFSTSKLRFDVGRWMSVGQYTNKGIITTSTDGVSWTNFTPTPVVDACDTVAYGDNQWVVLGHRDTHTPPFNPELLTLSSSNGTSWLMRTGGVAGVSALDFGQGKWVACYYSNVYTAFSTNFNWTPTVLPTAFRAGRFAHLHFANDLWVMGGYLDTTTNPVPLIVTSTNGTNWIQRALSINGWVSAVTYEQGQWVAVGAEYVYTTQCAPNVTSTALVLTSPDGINWTRRDSGLPRSTTSAFSRSSLSAITWTGDEWVAVGSSYVLNERSVILTSPDGITWQKHNSSLGSGPEYGGADNFAAYGNGRVVTGRGSTLFASAPITLARPVLGLIRTGNQLLLVLTGSIGATYDIQQTLQLSTPSWTFRQSVTLSNASQILALSATNSSGFWRARRL